MPVLCVILESKLWTIPVARIKRRKNHPNQAPHRVPLSPQALAVLEEIKAVTSEPPFVFPSRQKAKHINPNTINRLLINHRAALGVEDFSPHDLRRTASTLMANADVYRFVIERVLNHADGTMTGIYDRHDYESKKREALNTLGRVIDEIVGK